MTYKDVIREIKQAANFSDSDYTDGEMISYINSAMREVMLPMIMEVREEYFVTSIDYPVNADENGSQYLTIPANAVGLKIRDLVSVDSQGNLNDVPRIALEQRTETDRYGFRFVGSRIKVSGIQGQDTFRLFYYKRPARIGEDYATITGFSGNFITVDQVPASFNNARSLDLCSENDLLNTQGNFAINSIAGKDIALSGGYDARVGDTLSLPGETPFPQIPAECHPTLAVVVAAHILQAEGADDATKMGRRAKASLDNMKVMLSDRSDGSVKKIRPNTIFRQRRQGYWY